MDEEIIEVPEEEAVAEGSDVLDESDAIDQPETSRGPSASERRKSKNEENAENNEKTLRAAATILKDKGVPYVSAIAQGVDAADKATGGRSTRLLGRGLNAINKMSGATPGGAGKHLQRASNFLGKSGIADAANNIANARNAGTGDASDPNKTSTPNKSSSSSNTTNTKLKGEIQLKLPLKVKIVLIAVIVAIALVMLAIFVLFGAETVSGAGVGSGYYTYGETCPTITVENTSCDDDGNNCTLVYDGNVELEDYVAGVVAAEVGNANNLEYYKLAAITVRTYVLNNIDDDCTVEGNSKFQTYMDVEDSSNSGLIKQAVKETESLVIIEDDDLINSDYSQACVVKADESNYYIRYGTETLGNTNMQEIPKTWDQNNSVFSGTLSNLYSMTDTSNTDYENKDCPNNNNDYGMSQIGAYYLITNQGYSYQSVISYYYGSNVQVVTNEMHLSGAEDFINPTRYINCSSPFGPRIHPVKGKQSNHTGIDIAISGGEPIYAAKDGIVRYVVSNVSAINNCNFGYGNYIIIDHEDGMSTLYAHIKYGTISDSIVAGAEIDQGDQIGEVGSTGCSTGNHLHYEVRENDKRVDPADYLNLDGATGTCRR